MARAVQIPIQVELMDAEGARSLLAVDAAEGRDGKPAGVTLLPGGGREVRSFGPLEFVTLVLSLSGTVSVGLLTNWLYDRLTRARPKRVVIDREVIELNDRGQLERVIRERIVEE